MTLPTQVDSEQMKEEHETCT